MAVYLSLAVTPGERKDDIRCFARMHQAEPTTDGLKWQWQDSR